MTVYACRSAVRLGTILFLFAGRPASAHESLTWLLPDLAPAFIREGKLVGQGFGDGQLHYLIERLSDVDHKPVFATTARIWYQIEHSDGTCTLTVKKTTSRERVAVFSRFSYWVMPNRLIVKSDRVASFTSAFASNGQIDLSRLSQDDDMGGAYEAGVSYGAVIDRFIADPRRRTRLEAMANLPQPIRLLNSDRIDFFFGLPMEIEYSRRGEELASPVTALKIKDVVSTRDDWGYVACSNRSAGRRLMARIDAILDQNSGRAAYLEPLRQWYGSEDFETAVAMSRETTGAP